MSNSRNPMEGVRVFTADDLGHHSKLQQLAEVLKNKGTSPDRWAEELGLTPNEVVAAYYDLNLTARPVQFMPPGNEWTRWWASGGRGSGKTFTSSKVILDEMRADPGARILLVGPTRKNILSTNLEGPSGLLSLAPPWMRLHHQPSKARVTAANGATLTYIAAEAGPGRLKGLAFSLAIADEVVAWELDPVGVYDEICITTRHKTARMMRENIPARVVISSTPEPSDVFKRILEDRDSLVVTRMSSFENAAHLDSATMKYYRRLLSTALGRQEYLGILSFDHLDAGLFAHIDWTKVSVETDKAPERFQRIVLGYDPVQGGISGRVDESGIVVIGLAEGGDGLLHSYILQDASMKTANPRDAAQKVVEVYQKWLPFADKVHVLAEVNKGGQTTIDLLKMILPSIRTEAVLANQSKVSRATPLAALMSPDVGLVHFVGPLSKFKALIEQMKSFDGTDNKADGRVDACAWPVFQYSWRSSKNRGAIQKTEASADYPA